MGLESKAKSWPNGSQYIPEITHFDVQNISEASHGGGILFVAATTRDGSSGRSHLCLWAHHGRRSRRTAREPKTTPDPCRATERPRRPCFFGEDRRWVWQMKTGCMEVRSTRKTDVLVNVWRTLSLSCLDLCSGVTQNRAGGRVFFFRKRAVGFWRARQKVQGRRAQVQKALNGIKRQCFGHSSFFKRGDTPALGQQHELMQEEWTSDRLQLTWPPWKRPATLGVHKGGL